MAERGKHRWTYVSAGSNTTISSAAGSLYTVVVSPGHGSSVILADATDLGATPNLNSDSITGLIGRIGEFSVSSNGLAPAPQTFNFAGLGFNSGLTVAATSNARLIVEWE